MSRTSIDQHKTYGKEKRRKENHKNKETITFFYVFRPFINDDFFVIFIFQKWLAFSSLHKPLFSEHSSVYFANSQSPPAGHNRAYCKVQLNLKELIQFLYINLSRKKCLSILSFKTRFRMGVVFVLWFELNRNDEHLSSLGHNMESFCR